jgi:hypothetical protein
MENREIAITIIISSLAFGLFQTHQALAQRPDLSPTIQPIPEAERKAPVAISGSNIYTAWDNATLHGDAIFFTKSTDGGKTYSNAMVLSPPNTNPKVSVIRNNVNIDAGGSTVAVTWWTNETGALNPVIRTSTDGGNTFGNLIRLNSTSTVGAHGSSIHTTNPAAVSTHYSSPSIRNVK